MRKRLEVGSLLQNLTLSLAAVLICLVLLEGALRLWNPFVFRLRGNRITLPTNVRWVYRTTAFPKLDSVIVNRRNSFGFRGPDPPPDFERYLSIVTIGGSTTECLDLTDGKTWRTGSTRSWAWPLTALRSTSTGSAD